jgi:hypothetical protein
MRGVRPQPVDLCGPVTRDPGVNNLGCCADLCDDYAFLAGVVHFVKRCEALCILCHNHAMFMPGEHVLGNQGQTRESKSLTCIKLLVLLLLRVQQICIAWPLHKKLME